MASIDIDSQPRLDESLCAVLELVPDAVLIADRDGRIVHINTLAERLVGYRLDELSGRPLEILVPERFRAGHEVMRREYARQPRMREMGSGVFLRLLRRDGCEVPVDISLKPWASPCGQLIFAALRDVTQHQQREDALRASEERFALAVRGSTDGIWDWNVLTDEVYYSPRFKELLGCEDHEMENVFASFETRLAPGDVERVHQALRDHFRDRKPYDIEYRLRTKSGEYRWFRARGQAIWDDADRPLRMAGSISDITEQKRSQQRFELAVRASPVALLSIDGTGTIRLVNAQTEATFGYRGDELLGRPLEMLLPERFRATHRSLRESFFQRPESRSMGFGRDLYGRRRDGSEFPIEVGLSLLETDEELLVLCGIADVTDRKQALSAMESAKEAAEAANRAKSDFLANMSHEIRTPLNAVIGMTELVLDTELTPLQRDYLTMVTESGDLLLSIINEILDFSKIEAGRVELDTAEFSLRDLVGDTMRALALRAHRKQLELVYDVLPDVPDRLVGDPSRIRQVLLNLVGNAIKFTETGEIVVRISCSPETDREVTLRCDVTDTGIGIPAEKTAVIFEAFAQADTSTTRRYGGTGLGLTICSKLVQLMGGRIWAESEVGLGSTFSFTAQLGLGTQQPEPSFALQASALQNLPVLVVDDNATNLKVLQEMLLHWRMAPTTVSSAADALVLLRERPVAERRFQLVLTDVNMPEMDGFTLCERIRSTPGLEDLVLVVLTSGDRIGDLSLCQHLGVAAHLLKPVKPRELLDVLLRVLGEAAAREGQAGEPCPPIENDTPRALSILLAEDSLFNQKLAVGLLSKWGHTVQVASDGREAVEAWERESFDLILMDVQMPEMNGLEAAAVIRGREEQTGRHIPIIALTARAMDGDREDCLAAGMDDFVPKPLRRLELLQAIQNCCPSSPSDCSEQL